jgi:hypothetical protein
MAAAPPYGVIGGRTVKWVTKDFVHLDRVATPWLIRRFVDHDAEFLFVPWDRQNEAPPDAIAFALDGADLGPHDAEGSTFAKVLRKYGLRDPGLTRMAAVVDAGVRCAVHGERPAPADTDGQIAVGLLAISEGLTVRATTDQEVLTASFPVYDALYAHFRVQAIVTAERITVPRPDRAGPGDRVRLLRALYARAIS